MLALLNHLILARFYGPSLDFGGIVPINIENIEKGQGITIAVMGMLIVFTALLLVSLAIAVLPKILSLLSGILPPESASVPVARSGKMSDEGEVLAAIGLALHYHQQGPSVTD